jgi:PEP-CTERM motif
MNTLKLTVAASASLLALALLRPLPAHADVLGAAYLNNSAAGDAVIGFSHGAADATFSIPSPTNSACTGTFAGDTLCFSSAVTNGYTLGGFIGSSGGTVLTGSSAALSHNLDNTVFEFTGSVTVTNGEMFQAGHDDGLQLQIGSDMVINAPGPTGFTTTPATYTGPSGTFSFDLVYGECCGAPAYLGIALPFESPPPSVPEPSTLALWAAGLLGLAWAVGRRRSRV